MHTTSSYRSMAMYFTTASAASCCPICKRTCQSDAVKAKREVDRYLHCYKRYHAHAEAQKFAIKQLKEMEERMMRLQETSDNVTWANVEYLKTANEQLLECQRVLKYTYCFAYYIPERVTSLTSSWTMDEFEDGINRSTSIDYNVPAKMLKDQFENHQEMLERFTENLSDLVKKSLKDIVRKVGVNQVDEWISVIWFIMIS